MNINYRQILIIVSVLILFELMSVGLKKCNSTPKDVFPLPLNENTSALLIGQWKREFLVNGTYRILVDEYTPDNKKYSFLSEIVSSSAEGLFGNSIDSFNYSNREGKLFITFNDGSKSNGEVLIFHNEDEFYLYNEGLKKYTKWTRISETKRLYLNDNSK